MNHNTQTNFSIWIRLPSEPCNFYVLRVRYLTNNPDEEDQGTTFHQCSDIQLLKSHTSVIQSVVDETILAKSQKDPDDCCTPPSFQTPFIHRIPDIDYTSEGVIYTISRLNKYMFRWWLRTSCTACGWIWHRASNIIITLMKKLVVFSDWISGTTGVMETRTIRVKTF